MTMILSRSFYVRSALEVAPALLGCTVVRTWLGSRLSGRIVEVEAYLGHSDAASHAFRGPTPRSQVMFGPPGYAYVYFIYGMYYCLNVVTGKKGDGEAVLIRALEPIQGIEVMQEHRKLGDTRHLTNGPGKLCQALAIDNTFYGHDLTAGLDLWIESHPSFSEDIYTSPRIGVSGDDRARTVPWRFFLRDNPHISRSALNKRADLWGV